MNILTLSYKPNYIIQSLVMKYYGNGLYGDVKRGRRLAIWSQTWQEKVDRAGKTYINVFTKVLGGTANL